MTDEIKTGLESVFSFTDDAPTMDDAEWDAYCAKRDQEAAAEIFGAWVGSYVETLPRHFQAVEFDTYQTPDPSREHALSELSAFVLTARKGGTGVFLTGGVGAGKSHLAIAASKKLVGLGWRGRYIDVPAYLGRLRESFDGKRQCPEPRRMVESVDFVVLDALDVDRPSEWTVDQIYAMVDAVYGAGIVVLVTSNLDYHELMPILGDRTVSRLVELTGRVKFGADDWRNRVHRGRRA